MNSFFLFISSELIVNRILIVSIVVNKIFSLLLLLLSSSSSLLLLLLLLIFTHLFDLTFKQSVQILFVCFFFFSCGRNTDYEVILQSCALSDYQSPKY